MYGALQIAAAFSRSITTQASLPLPVPQAPSPALTGALSKVRAFEYMGANTSGTNGINQAIGASSADLVFINVCSSDPPIDRAVADPARTKLIFGYMDIGEAFACAEPQLFTGTLPTWFGNPNPGFTGLYTVQYWNPAWKTALFSHIEQVMAKGVDGIFIDVLSADDEWSAGNIESNPVYADATPALATLLADVRTYVNTNYPGRTVYLVGNNPKRLALNDPTSLKNLDGIFNEFVFYSESLTDGAETQYRGAALAASLALTYAPVYAAMHVPVFGNDYPPLNNTAADLLSFDFYTSLGWIPSITTPVQTDAILSTGPFMFTATPDNSSVTGRTGFRNYLSGGMAPDATLTGGDRGDVFVGGPGQNTIVGGAGNDTIYAHPAYAGYKGCVVVALASENKGTATASPSIAISVNGKAVVPATPITAAYGTSVQVISVNVPTLAPISSVVLTVSGTTYTDENEYSQAVIQELLYDGVVVDLASGTYTDGGDHSGFTYSKNGTVSFGSSAFAVASPYLATTSDTIDGGGGINTVIYRAASSNYTLTHQSNGAWLVTSARTAEGPDTLTKIQNVRFSDKTISLTN
jgi:uncharacterized protein (TIGR01370 family)